MFQAHFVLGFHYDRIHTTIFFEKKKYRKNKNRKELLFEFDQLNSRLTSKNLTVIALPYIFIYGRSMSMPIH